jgi:hypothetical protein
MIQDQQDSEDAEGFQLWIDLVQRLKREVLEWNEELEAQLETSQYRGFRGWSIENGEEQNEDDDGDEEGEDGGEGDQ